MTSVEAGGRLLSKNRWACLSRRLNSGEGYLFRGGGSMRFHPNMRASTDHEPGPNIARAAPSEAIRKQTILSAGMVMNL